MDPASIIGVTAAALQFAECGWKFALTAKRLYDSKPDDPGSLQDLDAISQEVGSISSQLSSEASLLSSHKTNDSLRSLSSECKSMAAEITELVRDCCPKERGKFGQSIIAAAKTMLKKDKIEALERRLSSYQDLLSLQSEMNRGLELLLDVGFHNTEQLSQLKEKADSLASTQKVEFSQAALDDLKTVFSLSNEAKETTERLQKCLAQLYFDTMDERFVDVRDASPKTFEYMLDDDDSKLLGTHPELKVSFKQWLLSGGGIFHIAGKPGAGKSTLMKKLCEDSRTSRALRQWAGGTPPIFARFFFWKYGSRLQKNLQGLLQSLLHTVLSRCPDLFDKLFPNYHDGRLTHHDVFGAFDQLLEHGKAVNDSTYRFCFFIDGLDEFDADDENHSDFVERIQSWADRSGGSVKLCVSSRELPAFRGLPVDQKIRLHLLTRDDIMEFVRLEIANLKEFKDLRTEDDDAPELCDKFLSDLVHRAEGVFLWVAIVVKSIRKGLREHGDSIHNLQQKLARIPSELELFFRYMLDSIDEEYQEASYATFSVAMALAKNEDVEGMTLLRYSFLFDWLDRAGQITHSSRAPPSLSGGKLHLRLEKAMSRLAARCNCLLETQKTRWSTHLAFRDTVKFMHRSIPDFLEGQLQNLPNMKSIHPQEEILRTLVNQVRSGVYNPTSEVAYEISRAIQLVFPEPGDHSATRDYEDEEDNEDEEDDEDEEYYEDEEDYEDVEGYLRRLPRSESLPFPNKDQIFAILDELDVTLWGRQGLKSVSPRSVAKLSSGHEFEVLSIRSRKQKERPAYFVSVCHLAAFLGKAEYLCHRIPRDPLIAKDYAGLTLVESTLTGLAEGACTFEGGLATLVTLFESGISGESLPSITLHGQSANANSQRHGRAAKIISWEGSVLDLIIQSGMSPKLRENGPHFQRVVDILVKFGVK